MNALLHDAGAAPGLRRDPDSGTRTWFGAARHTLKNLYQGRELLSALVISELKLSVRGAALHYFWWLLDPLLMMAIYAFVIGLVLDRSRPHFLLFLFSALLPWKAFSNSLNHGVMVLRNSQNLINSVAFPRIVLPVTQVLIQLIYMASGLLVLAVFLLYDRITPTPWLLLLPALALIQFFLSTGVVVLLSLFGAWFKDAGNFVGFLNQIWFFASPTIYPLEQVPEFLRPYYPLNPMVGLIESYRAVLIQGQAPPWSILALSALSSLLIFLVSMAVFGRLERELPKVL